MLARLSVSGSPLTRRFNSSGNFGFPPTAAASPAPTPQTPAERTTSTTHGAPRDRFNYSPFNLTLTPSTRSAAFARLEHLAAHNLRLYARAFFNRRASINQAAARDTAGQPAQPTAGGFDVTELYGELELPLVSGATGADLIDVAAAARYFDYSTFERGVTRQARPALAPNRHRAASRTTWTEGFRAPNIGELFGGLTRLDAVIADPCAGFSEHQCRPERHRQPHRGRRAGGRQPHSVRRPDQRAHLLDGTPDSLTNLGLCSMADHADNTASRNRLPTTVYHDA